jgi:hypothetical protein
MLRFGRAAMPRRATLQTSDEIVIQIAHVQVSGHPELHETTDLNDPHIAPRGSRSRADQ